MMMMMRLIMSDWGKEKTGYRSLVLSQIGRRHAMFLPNTTLCSRSVIKQVVTSKNQAYYYMKQEVH